MNTDNNPVKWFENSLVQNFILENENVPIDKLILKLSKSNLPSDFIVNQVLGRKISKIKFPEIACNEEIIYPNKTSLEQSSSSITASYKSQLIKGNSLVDLTFGFGIDGIYFATKFNTIIGIEPNSELVKITRHNLNCINVQNIEIINDTAENFLAKSKENVDLIYIDPSRRTEGNRKVFMLKNCIPDIIALLPNIIKRTTKCMVKTSPLLDIHQSIQDLKIVTEVHVVAVDNECKEVIYICDKQNAKEIAIKTVHFTKDSCQKFEFNFTEELNTMVEKSEPLKYLYEPNAAILKSGGFKSIATYYRLKKIAENTHLYTSNELTSDFPGKAFEVIDSGPISSKYWKFDSQSRFRIKTRNFKLTPKEILKKLKIKEGGENYLIATTNSESKPIIIKCRSIG